MSYQLRPLPPEPVHTVRRSLGFIMLGAAFGTILIAVLRTADPPQKPEPTTRQAYETLAAKIVELQGENLAIRQELHRLRHHPLEVDPCAQEPFGPPPIDCDFGLPVIENADEELVVEIIPPRAFDPPAAWPDLQGP